MESQSKQGEKQGKHIWQPAQQTSFAHQSVEKWEMFILKWEVFNLHSKCGIFFLFLYVYYMMVYQYHMLLRLT